MTQAIFVTVRTGSSRLPRKALIELSPGRRTIEYLLDRLTHVSGTSLRVVCTTQLPEDDILEDIARERGAEVFRGSVEDKLDRWRGAAEAHGVTSFVTADGDDLLCDPGLLDEGLIRLASGTIDFLEAPEAPCGGFTFGLATTALQTVCQIKKTTDTEMMWVYFKDTGLFRTAELPIAAGIARPEYRLTLDYPEDLEFFRRVIGHFGNRTDVSMYEIVDYLDSHPEVVAINSFRQQEFLDNQARRTHLEV